MSDTSLHAVQHQLIDFEVPALACDCHTHVFGPATSFPFDAGRVYTPGDASVADLLSLQRLLQLQRVVIVQPSPYGADNRCTVDGLLALGDRARGVAVIANSTSEAQLQEMHHAGVRGVRLNLETGGMHDPVAAARQLEGLARRVAPLGWHVQLYTNLTVLAGLADVIGALEQPVVLDHFCGAQAALGTEQPHFDVLLDLARQGRAYVKLSAPHRISKLEDCADAAALAQALIAANPQRMLWGSDWPHPGARPGSIRRVDLIEPFNAIDDGRALNRLAQWAGDASTLRQILVANPARLYDF